MTSFACPPPAQHTLPLTALVHPGFGSAVVYVGNSINRCHVLHGDATLQDVEDLAQSVVEDHDWRLRIDGPLSSATYQRQAPGVWVLIERSEGFA
jgi:hypothetical protein